MERHKSDTEAAEEIAVPVLADEMVGGAGDNDPERLAEEQKGTAPRRHGETTVRDDDGHPTPRPGYPG